MSRKIIKKKKPSRKIRDKVKKLHKRPKMGIAAALDSLSQGVQESFARNKNLEDSVNSVLTIHDAALAAVCEKLELPTPQELFDTELAKLAEAEVPVSPNTLAASVEEDHVD